MRQPDHRSADCRVIGIASQVAHEALVDLQIIDWQSFQATQRRIAGAEIIERERHADSLELVQSIDGRHNVFHDRRFGDFELEQARIQPIIGKRLLDELRQVLLAELAGG